MIPDLTIGIINYNSKELLKQCLNSIYANTKGFSFEVVVVDNNSSDGSSQMVRKSFPAVNIISNRTNSGFAKAVNQIILASNAQYVFISNEDILLKDNSLRGMFLFMQNNPQVAAVGPKLLNDQGEIELSFNKRCSGLSRCILDNLFFYSFFRINFFEKYIVTAVPRLFSEKFNKSRPVAWLSGAAFLLRKSIAEEVGYMDENFFLYREDEDFFCRISKSGWQVYYFPQSTVVHCRSKATGKVSINLILESTKSTLYFYRKRYPRKLIILVKLLLTYRLYFELLIFGFAFLVSRSSKQTIGRKLKFCLEALRTLPRI